MFFNTKIKHFLIISSLLIFIDLSLYGLFIISRSIIWDSSYYLTTIIYSSVFIGLLLFIYRGFYLFIINKETFVIANSRLDKFIFDFASKNNMLDSLPDSFELKIIGKEGFLFSKYQNKLVVSFTTYDDINIDVDKSFNYVSSLCSNSLSKYYKKLKTN